MITIEKPLRVKIVCKDCGTFLTYEAKTETELKCTKCGRLIEFKTKEVIIK